MGIPDLIKKLFVEEKKRVVITRHEEEGRIEDLDRSVQKDLSYKEGEIAELKAKIHELEKEKGKEDADKEIAKKLIEKQQEYGRLNYRGGLSLKRFFKSQMEKKMLFDVLSYDEKKKFGIFNDIIFLPDGTLAIQISDGNGRKNIIMVASQLNLMFANYKGLRNSVARGSLRLNLTAKNEYYYNPLEERVPKVVYVDGKSVVLGQTQEYLVQQLADLHEEHNELLRQLQLTEEALSREVSRRKTMYLGAKLNEVRAESAETELKQAAATTSGMVKTFNQSLRDSANLASSLKMTEDMLEELDKSQVKILGQITEYLKKPEYDLAKEQIEEIGNYLVKRFVQMSNAHKLMVAEVPEAEVPQARSSRSSIGPS